MIIVMWITIPNKERTMPNIMTPALKSVILVGIFTVVAIAQPKYGVTLGFISSTLSFDDSDADEFSKSKSGFTIGGSVVYPLNANLDLRSGLSLTQKGSKTEFSEEGISIEGTTDFSYLTIPLLAQYKMNSAGNTLYALGGLDIGILMSADIESKLTVTIFGETFAIDTSVSVKDSIESLDIALNVGGGYMMEMGTAKLYVEVQYSLGLLNIDATDPNAALKTRGLIIGVGYIF